jgi:hypothetical protein
MTAILVSLCGGTVAFCVILAAAIDAALPHK